MADLMLRIRGNDVEIEAEGDLEGIVADWSYLTKLLRERLQVASGKDLTGMFRVALEFSEIYRTPRERNRYNG